MHCSGPPRTCHTREPAWHLGVAGAGPQAAEELWTHGMPPTRDAMRLCPLLLPHLDLQAKMHRQAKNLFLRLSPIAKPVIGSVPTSMYHLRQPNDAGDPGGAGPQGHAQSLPIPTIIRCCQPPRRLPRPRLGSTYADGQGEHPPAAVPIHGADARVGGEQVEGHAQPGTSRARSPMTLAGDPCRAPSPELWSERDANNCGWRSHPPGSGAGHARPLLRAINAHQGCRSRSH